MSDSLPRPEQLLNVHHQLLKNRLPRVTEHKNNALHQTLVEQQTFLVLVQEQSEVVLERRQLKKLLLELEFCGLITFELFLKELLFYYVEIVGKLHQILHLKIGSAVTFNHRVVVDSGL